MKHYEVRDLEFRDLKEYSQALPLLLGHSANYESDYSRLVEIHQSRANQRVTTIVAARIHVADDLWFTSQEKMLEFYTFIESIPPIQGTVSYFIEQKYTHNGRKVMHIEDLAVLPELRRKGIGRQLMKKCHEIAKENGCYKVILDTKSVNFAFYHHLGYAIKEQQMRLEL